MDYNATAETKYNKSATKSRENFNKISPRIKLIWLLSRLETRKKKSNFDVKLPSMWIFHFRFLTPGSPLIGFFPKTRLNFHTQQVQIRGNLISLIFYFWQKICFFSVLARNFMIIEKYVAKSFTSWSKVCIKFCCSHKFWI